MTKQQTKEIKYVLIGAFIGLLLTFPLQLLGIDAFNWFYTPLSRILPVPYVVTLFFALIGAVVGYLVAKAK